jgi:3',5'-nucleoside bisphosphate phosphatase
MKNNIDLHLHTTVSDGEVTPIELIHCAQEIGLEEISITDHDAVGAYRNYGMDPVKEAQKLGINLIRGIELDSFYKDEEIHVLGYGIDIENKELNDYLGQVQGLRKERLREQISQANRVLGFDIEEGNPIINSIRDTVMNPHLVRPLLTRGLFSEYREAANWLEENTQSSIKIPKPTTCEMIAMIQSAGGHAYIAHAGYYVEEGGLDLETMVQDFKACGLEGIEVQFPYFNTSPKFKTMENETRFIARLLEMASKYDLKTSKGSDAHDLEKMRSFAKRG